MNANPWGLPGEFRLQVSDQFADALLHDSCVVLVEQDLRPTGRVLAGWFPVSYEALNDRIDVDALIRSRLDRVFRPWRYADRPAFPTIDLFPRLTATRAVLTRARGRLRRRHDGLDPWGDE